MNRDKNLKFLASPPPLKTENAQTGAKRTILGDISSLMNRWGGGSGENENKDLKVEKVKENCGRDKQEADVESPQQLPQAVYVSLEDAGSSPIRNALWNDDNAC